MNEEQMRKIVNLVVEELRGNILFDQSITAKMLESIKDELARLFENLQTLEHNQSSMQLHLIQDMSHISIRLSKIEVKIRKSYYDLIPSPSKQK